MAFIPVVPALIPQSAAAVAECAAAFNFSRELHLDVVDGTFVPFTSWPIVPPGNPSEVRAHTDRYTLEVDLMVANPLPLARSFVAAGADMIVFHIETISLDDLQQFADEVKVSIGVSAHNSTGNGALAPYLEIADYVQVMGIAAIGSQGQPFDPAALERIVWLKSISPALFISVDGSVNKTSIPRIVHAGADRLICGSAIVAAPDPALAHAELQSLANNSQPYL